MNFVFLGIVFSTFVLEDLAMAASLLLVQQQKISFEGAFLACFIGISIGDLALYSLGLWAKESPFLLRFEVFKRAKKYMSSKNLDSLGSWIFLCRFVPGTRVPTYLASGIAGYSVLKFILVTIVSVGLWVGLAFLAGISVLQMVKQNWQVTTVLLFLVFKVCRNLFVNLSDPWLRRAYLPSFRQWLTFEFWPAWFFYTPIVINYIYLSIRFLNPFQPFFSNPGIHHSGMVGESKWDFLKHLPAGPSVLKTFLVPSSSNQRAQLLDLLKEGLLRYPLILKPDIGQRGYAVRIVHQEKDLEEYLQLSNFDILAQEFCDFSFEAGVFYIRIPSEDKPFIFSITDKIFPSIACDGISRIGDLILQDPRARIIAATYFERFQGRLEEIPKQGTSLLLSSCGNHCQGAIFKDGNFLNSPALLKSIDQLARQVPGFYFGRFDLRYESQEQLSQGKGFKIVEINGAGSEATHIWDSDTKLTAAYKTLFRQWYYVFKIGSEVRKLKIEARPFNFFQLLKDLLRFQKPIKGLRVSS